MVFGTGYHPDLLPAQTKAASVFTPAAPIDSMTLFRGRSAQVQMLLETVNQVGQHAIIYGERGVGKTSLASVLFEIVSKSVLSRFIFAHINCDIEDTYASLWRKVFRELHVNDRGQVTVAQHTYPDKLRTPAEWLTDGVSPDDIRRLSSMADGRLVVMIDEFDQLSGNPETVRLVANTIKTLSDRRASVTLMLVGVADTVSQLVSEHESVERNLVQIHMPRMSDGEIGLIIREGLSDLGITIPEQLLPHICSLAQGLPASAHRIGLQLAYRMIETRGFVVTREDIDAALDAAIDRMPQSHFMDWQEATQGTPGASLFENVLIASALAPRNEQGWFQGNDILEPLRVLTDNAQHQPLAYSQHLHRLSTQRGKVLDRSKAKGRWQFRFRNPSFQSYVIMRGLSSGRLKDSALDRFKENLPQLAALV